MQAPGKEDLRQVLNPRATAARRLIPPLLHRCSSGAGKILMAKKVSETVVLHVSRIRLARFKVKIYGTS